MPTPCPWNRYFSPWEPAVWTPPANYFDLGTSKSWEVRQVETWVLPPYTRGSDPGFSLPAMVWNIFLYHGESQPNLTTSESSCSTTWLFTPRIRSPSRRPWRWAEVPGSTLHTTCLARPSSCCRWKPKLLPSSLLSRQKRGRSRLLRSGGRGGQQKRGRRRDVAQVQVTLCLAEPAPLIGHSYPGRVWAVGPNTVGRVAGTEGNTHPPPCPCSYSQLMLLSEGDRVVTKEMGGCVEPWCLWGRGMVTQGVGGLPEESWSSARDRTGLSIPSFGLNSNFLQGGPRLYLRCQWQLKSFPTLDSLLPLLQPFTAYHLQS